MLKRNMGLWFVTVCYLGLCGGLCAIPFVEGLVAPAPADGGTQWPMMHASAVEFMLQPAASASVKE